MSKMEKYTINYEDSIDSTDEEMGVPVFPAAVEEMADIDLFGPVDLRNPEAVLQRIFDLVEKYPTGIQDGWFRFLNNFDRDFVLNLYGLYVATGTVKLSLKQSRLARAILIKMLTPSFNDPKFKSKGRP